MSHIDVQKGVTFLMDGSLGFVYTPISSIDISIKRRGKRREKEEEGKA